MPRQDVPYGGAICRLKERIAEIWDKLDQKLHSINGVEGDGAGNVDIVSGNAAVVINNDQIGHRIEVGLDSSKLPAAAVSSVNGQTGAVRLDAVNILSDRDSNVQADIDLNKAAINDCFDSITTEQNDRKAADDTLQGNINSVQASIPGAAAAAVSNDPTVTQLAADVPNKLDKISSGNALKAYTHTGQNQGETSVVNGVDANSIGLRDANGRMQAADPAAGATDKTLVTANWVSQTGDSGPNNLIHKNGNETKLGILNLPDGYEGIMRQHAINTNNTSDNIWRLGFSLTMNNNDTLIVKVFSAFNNTDTQEAIIKIVKGNTYVGCRVVESSGTTAEMASAKNYVTTVDGNTVSFYTLKRRKYTNLYCVTLFYGTYGSIKKLPNIVYSNTDSADPSTETHDLITIGGNVPYHNLE